MDERTIGVILRTRPLTETSLIVQWLTRDFGRVATVAKGARRAKSPFHGKLDLLYLADLTFHRSRRSDLHTLREVSVVEFNSALREELGYLQQAAYFVRLLEQTTEMDAPVPELFEMLAGVLRALPHQRPDSLAVFAFEARLLAELGLKPDFQRAGLSSGARELLEQAVSKDWLALLRIRLNRTQRSEVEDFLHGFLAEHLGKVPAGRAQAVAAGNE